MIKEKYQVGQTVTRHEDAESSDCCYQCGKELKTVKQELRIALTENLSLSTLKDIESTWYSTEWSPRVGNECVKRFPAESVFKVEVNA